MAAVGGAGWLLVGIAVALLANNTGGYTVSSTVSVLMAQGGGSMVEDTSFTLTATDSSFSKWLADQSPGLHWSSFHLRRWADFHARSSTSSKHGSIQMFGIQSAPQLLSSSGEVTPEGVRLVQSDAP